MSPEELISRWLRYNRGRYDVSRATHAFVKQMLKNFTFTEIIYGLRGVYDDKSLRLAPGLDSATRQEKVVDCLAREAWNMAIAAYLYRPEHQMIKTRDYPNRTLWEEALRPQKAELLMGWCAARWERLGLSREDALAAAFLQMPADF